MHICKQHIHNRGVWSLVVIYRRLFCSQEGATILDSRTRAGQPLSGRRLELREHPSGAGINNVWVDRYPLGDLTVNLMGAAPQEGSSGTGRTPRACLTRTALNHL